MIAGIVGLGLIGGSFAKASLSIDSSIIPQILQYPPSGNQPIPYSVSEFFGLYLKRLNQGSKKR